MTIINTNVVRTPSVNDVVALIKTNNTQAFNRLKQSVVSGYNAIWRNNSPIGQKYTPEEVIAAFGTDAAALFELSYNAQVLLKSIDPEYEILTIPAGYTISFNTDGSAVVTKS